MVMAIWGRSLLPVCTAGVQLWCHAIVVKQVTVQGVSPNRGSRLGRGLHCCMGGYMASRCGAVCRLSLPPPLATETGLLGQRASETADAETEKLTPCRSVICSPETPDPSLDPRTKALTSLFLPRFHCPFVISISY